MSDKTIFLSRKTQKSIPFTWSEQGKVSLTDLLNEIKTETLLTFPDLNKDFKLHVDASDDGIGGILTQEGKTIGFHSRKFTPPERNFSIVEKETIAILDCLNHFRSTVLFSTIFIFTDNRNLIFTNDLSKRVAKWKLELEEFDYVLDHINGVENSAADSLSRLFTSSHSIDFVCPYDYIDIAINQKSCDSISQLELQGKTKSSKVNGISMLFDLKDRLLIPTAISSSLVDTLHVYLEHPGERSLYS